MKMGRACIVCAHKSRKEIDKMLVEPNAQYSAISRMFFGSDKQRDALRRHVENGHIIAKIKKVAAAQEALEANDFLGHLQNKRDRFKEMAAAAQKADDPHLELKIYQVEGKYTEMEGKALGVFKEDKSNGTDNTWLGLMQKCSPKK
ncbi:hypothetical protein [Methanoregula sp.]|uniref:hypothetical protein n=1 Tax=Methanoregula sp. TaxID=2052170 RepID=UPI003567BEEB